MTNDVGMLSRAQGCLLGQLAGDALGSLVEFQTPKQIRRQYPDGVRELADGGTWNTIAGQPTDDSEMALLLARLLADQRKYDPREFSAWSGLPGVVSERTPDNVPTLTWTRRGQESIRIDGLLTKS